MCARNEERCALVLTQANLSNVNQIKENIKEIGLIPKVYKYTSETKNLGTYLKQKNVVTIVTPKPGEKMIKAKTAKELFNMVYGTNQDYKGEIGAINDNKVSRLFYKGSKINTFTENLQPFFKYTASRKRARNNA